MCGIAGFVGVEQPESKSRVALGRMCDAIRHRGPDDAGYFTAPGVAIGMRRLSIIDLAGGHQPIANEDGSIQTVFNGEIYNYRELRQDLLRRGHHLSTHGDTETLVHLYEDVGERLVQHLRGMFGFAIWDERRQRLLLARDRLGIKPLYYWQGDGVLAFASELKALVTLDIVPREVDPAAVADYLALGYVPDPGCIFKDVKKLEPGHVLMWDKRSGVTIQRYWSPIRAEDPSLDETEAKREIRRLLTEAVRYRLIADVPLGAFLSGGVDSASVVAEMSRQMDRPVNTFSIGFEEPQYNEAPHAAEVARALRTNHTELIVRPDVDALFEQIVSAFDEPFADSSAIPTLLVSKLARSQVTVALSGDGGDELFGGYTRYREVLRRDLAIPQGARGMIAFVSRALPHSTFGRNRLLELSRTQRGRYAGQVADPLAVSEGGVARPEVLAAGRAPDHLLERWFEAAAGRDLPSQMMLVDLLSYLPGDILTKVDRMSMAVSLEARVPLLDHHLVEFAVTIPSSLKIRDGSGKWIFRESVKDLIPESVLTKRKQGFGVPISEWLRGPLRHRIDQILRPDAELYAYVDPDAVSRIIREHLSGRRDHSPLIWKLLVLALWLREQATGARDYSSAAGAYRFEAV
jgi:asparagine synthase (glutamine-hydrolysing)